MKKIALALGLVAVPALTLAATAFQDPSLGTDQPRNSTRVQNDSVRRQLQDRMQVLEEQLMQARRRLESNEQRLEVVRQRLNECADLAVDAVVENDHHNCTPSRNLISHFQWMHENELPEPADRLLTHIVDQHRGDPERLARLARNLMTDDELAGRFDAAALAISERANGSIQRPHAAVFDAYALALFLNERFDEAVLYGRQALQAAGREDERLMRRLRTYETAASALESPTESNIEFQGAISSVATVVETTAEAQPR
ncbi:MAG: hypothetical protein AAF196_08450 [Planctomycetota bacterium]